ncbi:3-keto-5-aminohexanoate cleavage protein [Lutimaribacter sp. EGI FJ00015]|uniref:3-keto-5-aminohexanoate cleavage protein n=1 Tax=Lutimaribacter degradans TaxID=2945989 RepID=A0ACC6A0M9_9RHOB|nr:3-keto-5-aminohexanoate cleavage protein [Lutimaribacter sp. EGI FJ00013]MCM2563556.1 3-keto-5-aminohexanoate cleavage protein [Lutimaribacter sp. EGI FJ00013]MCO0614781.1 3-keto-5-aminohexanoate cleavage protein [Lutimaribacter sp. EGI FJ00015]MCO0637450.1 3-keto-5-aminohexanoate cleavage protein [Lutimaribacter sp. EGI FJ00014]
MDKAILTCALNGVLTDPAKHPVPVTPEDCAASAKEAMAAGASVIHVHYRQQAPGKGHLPSWDTQMARDIVDAIRAACPGIVINSTTGTVGPNYQGALDVLRALRPEIGACNAGSLNYLKLRRDGSWAWPPMLFDNTPQKVGDFLNVMSETGTRPEFECFDTGIVRSVGMYVQNGMAETAQYNLVMGVASGMPVDAALLDWLMGYLIPRAPWQATLIGREEIWPVHQRAAELGGMLRTGVEDTFYLPDGRKTRSNGQLIEALAGCAENAGRAIASPAEARQILDLPAV